MLEALQANALSNMSKMVWAPAVANATGMVTLLNLAGSATSPDFALSGLFASLLLLTLGLAAGLRAIMWGHDHAAALADQAVDLMTITESQALLSQHRHPLELPFDIETGVIAFGDRERAEHHLRETLSTQIQRSIEVGARATKNIQEADSRIRHRTNDIKRRGMAAMRWTKVSGALFTAALAWALLGHYFGAYHLGG